MPAVLPQQHGMKEFKRKKKEYETGEGTEEIQKILIWEELEQDSKHSFHSIAISITGPTLTKNNEL